MSDTAGNGPAPAADEAQGPREVDTEGSAAPGDPQLMAEQLSAAQAEAQSNREDYLRLAAELENLRKRAAREAENARQFGIERFAGDLLDVVDSLEMGLAAAGASAEALREGSVATLRQLTSAFEKHGVSVVDPVGESFDPQRHEALTTQPSAHAEPGSILSVVQKGYLLNGRLLRPARVIVAAEALEPGADEA